MALLDSVLGAITGKNQGELGASQSGMGATALIGIIGGLLQQNGGLQGLANRFSQAGQGNAFASWVGTGENEPISSNQIQEAVGTEQVAALASKMGIDPNQASQLLAQFLPKVVDKLTPEGKVDPTADHQQGLARLLPALMQSFGRGSTPA